MKWSKKLQAILWTSRINKRLHCSDQWNNFFDQPVENYLRTYDNIQKLTTGQGDDYTTGCLLHCTYFKNIKT